MLKKILYILAIVVVLVAGYKIGSSSNTVQPAGKDDIDYLSINTSESIGWSLSDSETVQHNREVEVTQEFENFVYEYLCKEVSDLCDQDDKTVEMQLSEVDLDEDGELEYISLPRIISGNMLRGTSGNGVILIIEKNEESDLTVIASLIGNSYVILNSKINGYYKILTHVHSSSASGAETVYAKEQNNFSINGFEYVEQFTKWYRHYQD
jgi:hypothetical protein